MVRLVEIGRDGESDDAAFVTTAQVAAVIRDTIKLYEKSGFNAPWVSYLGVLNNEVVGVCAFKSAPKANQVEVAYFTFEDHEGRGYASEMLRSLIKLAYSNNSAIRITARTLKDRNASHRVLEKCGFFACGTVVDPEDGEVLEWRHQPSSMN